MRLERADTFHGETRALHGCAAPASPLGGLYATLGYIYTRGGARRLARRTCSPRFKHRTVMSSWRTGRLPRQPRWPPRHAEEGLSTPRSETHAQLTVMTTRWCALLQPSAARGGWFSARAVPRWCLVCARVCWALLWYLCGVWIACVLRRRRACVCCCVRLSACWCTLVCLRCVCRRGRACVCACLCRPQHAPQQCLSGGVLSEAPRGGPLRRVWTLPSPA
ncbi:hypothetical protein ABL78_3928 [Leptomonas seymouri]|uniref:Uncharacterized protein n=1 Tax=Leptomonas seymouri TaxID=5684 RepID=A0A0N0P5Y7_LEPSE|nr:hypothetical protein ABL78_3928 [Leptomonas seymouri]|eukprot:KPI87016.1 hypothetical protein ABL78_3928 [Leptomonas seymouri]